MDFGQIAGNSAPFELAGERDENARYKIVSVELATSQIEPVTEAAKTSKDPRLRLVEWATPIEEAMAVFVPAALPSNADVQTLRTCLMNTSPPGEGDEAFAIIAWARIGWQIEEPNHTPRPFRCNDIAVEARRNLRVRIPPTTQLRQELLKQLTPYAGLLQTNPAAPFEVIGRLQGGRLEYSLAKRFQATDDILPARTEWNRDWFVNNKNQAEQMPPAGETIDCSAKPAECAQLLQRRIQRTRSVVDLVRAQGTANRIVTPAGAIPPPWRLELRETEGKSCLREAVEAIVAKKTYCLFALYQDTGEKPLRWYLSLWSIDSAGLSWNVNKGSTAYPDSINPNGAGGEVLLVPDYNSTPYEGNRENLFLFVTTDPALNSAYQVEDSYQQQPNSVTARGLEPRPFLYRRGLNARGDSLRPPSWAIIHKSLVVKP